MNDNKQTASWLLGDESFRAWLAGKAGAAESSQWNDWLHESPDHRLLYEEAKHLISRTRFRSLEPPHIDLQWEKLRLKLKPAKARPQSIFALADWMDKLRLRQPWPRYALAMAAVVLIVASARYFHVFDFDKSMPNISLQTISTEFGQRSTIDLPEGTRITLNANSTLRYPTNLPALTDLRFELKGEAYFAVSTRTEKPGHHFIVHTADGAVQVTGTRFVVHERGMGTRVVVEEGGVEVFSDDNRNATPDIARVSLKPGDLVHFNRGDKNLLPSRRSGIAVAPYTTWREKQLVFEKTPFREIVQRLQETYGVQITVKNERLLDRRLSGKIKNFNLVITTDALASALNVPVRRTEQMVVFGD